MMISNALIMAIMAIESGGDDLAMGDNGGSLGCMQISESCLADVNSIGGAQYSRSDRLDRAKSIDIFRAYIGKYATKKRLGRSPTQSDIARIWNAGPDGYKKPTSMGYWQKVKGAIP
jgi:soluble lytic murein transglycosylase-like protein